MGRTWIHHDSVGLAQVRPNQMWQSWAEIDYYSIAYFDRITAFEVLKCRTSTRGGAHTCCVNMSSVYTVHTSPTNVKILHYSASNVLHSNAIEI